MERKPCLIRHARETDVQKLTALERLCFPEAEAAGLKQFQDRVRVFGNHFWLLEEDGKLISCVNGMTTDEPSLTDAMYASADLHNEQGAWQMIFGVTTHPDHRMRGCASYLLREVIRACFFSGRKGIVLTCKEKLLPFYSRLGFVNEGPSTSEHGGAKWYEMRLTFSDTLVLPADPQGLKKLEEVYTGHPGGRREDAFLAWDRRGEIIGYACFPEIWIKDGSTSAEEPLMQACRTQSGQKKKALRNKMLAMRHTMDPALRRQMDRDISRAFLQTDWYRQASSVFCYVSVSEEISTRDILRHVLADGKTLLVPRCRPHGKMDMCRIASPEDLERLLHGEMAMFHGIPQPPDSFPSYNFSSSGFPSAASSEEGMLCVVPCLCFDGRGHRVGYGGGYYDRFLSAHPCRTVLLGRELMRAEEVPDRPEDMAVQAAVTEKGFEVFPVAGK